MFFCTFVNKPCFYVILKYVLISTYLRKGYLYSRYYIIFVITKSLNIMLVKTSRFLVEKSDQGYVCILGKHRHKPSFSEKYNFYLDISSEISMPSTVMCKYR